MCKIEEIVFNRGPLDLVVSVVVGPRGLCGLKNN